MKGAQKFGFTTLDSTLLRAKPLPSPEHPHLKQKELLERKFSSGGVRFLHLSGEVNISPHLSPGTIAKDGSGLAPVKVQTT
tara:strand:+ start:2184 stop:2426 length:243 start_codon:yes stop_codon:yes gene_type:complete